MAEKQSEQYLTARREWLERYGDYIAQARNWRMAALLSLGISALFGAGMVYEADRVHVVPYVVEVNHLGQSVHLAQEVAAGTYQTPIVRHVLAHWLRLVRERLPNEAAEKYVFNEAYKYTASSAQQKLTAYFQRHNPYNAFTNKTGGRTVQITSALPLGQITAKGGTFQIQWTETSYSQEGSITGTQHYEGTVSYAVVPQSDNAASLKANPFGIYVTSFDWNPIP